MKRLIFKALTRKPFTYTKFVPINKFTMSVSSITLILIQKLSSQKPEETIFAKMARGEMKPDIVYQDDKCLVFKDINPQAPTHLLIISKEVKIGQVHEANDNDAAALGHLLVVAGKVAKQLKLGGYRLVINQGTDAQQSVNYLHIHLLSGRKFTWYEKIYFFF